MLRILSFLSILDNGIYCVMVYDDTEWALV